MFFLSNNNTQICNMPGLTKLIELISCIKTKQHLVSFVSIHNTKEEVVNIGTVHITKIKTAVMLYSTDNSWSMSMLIDQLLYFCNSYDSFKNKAFIVTFNGYNFKFYNFNQNYLTELVSKYLNKDIYIGVELINDVYAEAYSTNREGLRLLFLFLGEAYCILLAQNEIEEALLKNDTEKFFASNREICIKILNHNYLRLFETESKVEYKIHKNVFFKLLTAFNAHNHEVGQSPYCKETVIVIDDQDTYVELID